MTGNLDLSHRAEAEESPIVVADRDLSHRAENRLSHIPGASVQELRIFAVDATGSTVCRHKTFQWLNLRSAPTNIDRITDQDKKQITGKEAADATLRRVS